MVKLTKIYTKIGDKGETMLGDGSRVAKSSKRVNAYGDVDEANAAIGMAICGIGSRHASAFWEEITRELKQIQNDLFDVGADLCKPMRPTDKRGGSLRIVEDQTAKLESLIDRVNDRMEPLNSFVLPGGSELAARFHVARTVIRRAERSVAELLETEPGETNPQTLVYLNRLSDLMFVLGRAANNDGKDDVLWVPGANR